MELEERQREIPEIETCTTTTSRVASTTNLGQSPSLIWKSRSLLLSPMSSRTRRYVTSLGNVTEEETFPGDNFSSRISEILSMPTPRRKLQPILKPILNKSRPKAAFKRRTPLHRIPSKVRSAKGLHLRQMLNMERQPEPTHEHQQHRKASDLDTSSSKSNGSIHSSKREPRQQQKKFDRYGLHPSQSADLVIEDHSLLEEQVYNNKEDGKTKEMKSIASIVIPTTSIDSASASPILEVDHALSAKNLFPCLLYCSQKDQTETRPVMIKRSKETTCFENDVVVERKKKVKRPLKKRILTLIELLAKRDKAKTVKPQHSYASSMTIESFSDASNSRTGSPNLRPRKNPSNPSRIGGETVCDNQKVPSSIDIQSVQQVSQFNSDVVKTNKFYLRDSNFNFNCKDTKVSQLRYTEKNKNFDNGSEINENHFPAAAKTSKKSKSQRSVSSCQLFGDRACFSRYNTKLSPI